MYVYCIFLFENEMKLEWERLLLAFPSWSCNPSVKMTQKGKGGGKVEAYIIIVGLLLWGCLDGVGNEAEDGTNPQ